jgi:antitoxin CptB
MKELDVLLERFLGEHYPHCHLRDRQAFERLLGEPDPELMSWLLGHGRPADPQLAEAVRLILRCGLD